MAETLVQDTRYHYEMRRDETGRMRIPRTNANTKARILNERRLRELPKNTKISAWRLHPERLPR